jgi:hypothetical protein
MATNIHSEIKFYKHTHNVNRVIYGAGHFHQISLDLISVKVKDYSILHTNVLPKINLYNVVRALTKFDLLFTESNGFVEIKGENLLVTKGIVLDMQSLDYLAVVVYHNKYSNVVFQNSHPIHYRNKCLELFISSKIFDNQRLIKKLTPYISELKTTILSHEDLNKLFTDEEH